jgi:ankyrin repeat protein
MNMKTVIIFCFYFISSGCMWLEESHGGIDPHLVKGVDQLIRPECRKKVSPVFAMAFIKSGTLSNLRFWGNYGEIPRDQAQLYPSCQWAGRWGRDDPEGSDDCPLDATSALVQSLFPSHARRDLIPNQGSTDDPISKLTAGQIGSLIELIEDFEVYEKVNDAPMPLDSWSLKVFHILEPNAYRGALGAFHERSDEFLRCENSPIHSSLVVQTKHVMSDLQEMCTEVGQGPQVKNGTDPFLKLRKTKKWKAIESWARILYGAVQDSKAKSSLYPLFTPQRALMSYLLLKNSRKESLLEFLKAAPSCLSLEGRELIQLTQLRHIEKGSGAAAGGAAVAVANEDVPGSKDRKLDEFLSAHFNSSEFNNFLKNPTPLELDQLSAEPERLGFYLYLSNSSDLPPLIGGQTAAHKSLGKDPDRGSTRKYNTYADCGEASIRNFFNIVFYHPETKRFQTEILDQMVRHHHLTPYRDISKKDKPDKIGVEKGLYAFYTRNFDTSLLFSDQVRDDWSRRVVSHLPGVHYLKPRSDPKCEMSGGIDNALQLMGHLLGDAVIKQSGDHSKRKVALDRLCEVSSRDGFQLTWQNKSKSPLENIGETLIFSINGKPKFQWEFLAGHFSLTEIKDTSTNQTDWSYQVSKNEPVQELLGIWKPVKQSDYRTADVPMLWNQQLGNSEVRLELLDQALWDERSGSIAYHWTHRDLSFDDEAVHQKVAVASLKTKYGPLVEALSHAPPEIRVRSAAYAGDLATLVGLAAHFAKRDGFYRSVAHLAALNGQAAALRFIAEQVPQSLMEKDAYGQTPAHLAGQFGHLEVLKFIVEKAFESILLADSRGQTPAHLAARFGHVDVFKFITEKAPASLFVKSVYRNTPAHSAVLNDQTAVLEFIAEKFPQLLMEKDSGEQTPAHIAAQNGRSEALEIISRKALQSLMEKDTREQTPAHLAAQSGKIEALRVITEKAPQSLLLKDQNETTPVHFLARDGRAEILRFIMERAPESLRVMDHREQTPTHWAAINDQIEVLKVISEKAPDLLMEKDYNRQTSAHLAIQSGQTAALKFIIEKAPHIMMERDTRGRTPAHLAAEVNNREALKIIADQAPDSFIEKDNQGRVASDFIDDPALKGEIELILKKVHGKEKP